MNPEHQAPQPRHEYQPPAPDSSEHLPTPEHTGEKTYEREQNMRQVDRSAGPPMPVPVVPLPPQAPSLPTVSNQAADDSVGPTIASDDDLIEKEWVDKAKKIIAETQNDPYRREKEVTKLQVDYLRKRYGKELGTSN